MRIEQGIVVTLDYRVVDADGNVVDDGQDPMVYVHGDDNQLFPKLQAALGGKEIGHTTEVALEPEDAFGEYDPELVRVEDRSVFPADIMAGVQFHGGPEGEEPTLYTVTEIRDDSVVLDANHPLAGTALVFTCTVAALRQATAEELEACQLP